MFQDHMKHPQILRIKLSIGRDIKIESANALMAQTTNNIDRIILEIESIRLTRFEGQIHAKIHKEHIRISKRVLIEFKYYISIEKSEQKDLQYQFLNQQNRLEKLIYQCVIDMIQKELGSLVIYDKQQDQSRESKRSFDKFKTKKSDMLHLIKLTSLRTRFSTLNLELSIQYLWNLTNYAWIEIDDNNIYYVKDKEKPKYIPQEDIFLWHISRQINILLKDKIAQKNSALFISQKYQFKLFEINQRSHVSLMYIIYKSILRKGRSYNITQQNYSN
ncbi:hypothetical protein pb186bvf_008808 [Paramecium bursaria]